jgi:hypothetical protein
MRGRRQDPDSIVQIVAHYEVVREAENVAIDRDIACHDRTIQQ